MYTRQGDRHWQEPLGEQRCVSQELEELHEWIDVLERALAARQPPTELAQAQTPV